MLKVPCIWTEGRIHGGEGERGLSFGVCSTDQ